MSEGEADPDQHYNWGNQGYQTHKWTCLLIQVWVYIRDTS